MTSVANSNAPGAMASVDRPPAQSSLSSSSSSAPTPLSALSLAMTPPDADRMAEASRALQSCLRRVPIPADSTTSDSASTVPSSNHKQRGALNDSNQTNGAAAPKDESATKTTAATYIDSTEALHELMDDPRHGNGTLVLHGMLLEAAQQCHHSMVESFLPRMMASGVSEAQAKAGLVIFHEMDKSSKLKLVFEVLAAVERTTNDTSKTTASPSATGGAEQVSPDHDQAEAAAAAVSTSKDKSKQSSSEHDHKENALPNNKAPRATAGAAAFATPSSGKSKRHRHHHLDQEGAHSLFQTILTAISCCVHSKDDLHDSSHDIALKPVVTLDEDISTKDSFDAPPKEMTKMGEDDVDIDESKPSSSAGHSPKTSVPGLAEELINEIESSSANAARSLVEFCLSKTNQARSKNNNDATGEEVEVAISFDIFGDWYNQGGCQMVPWLELLHLSKWKMSAAVVPSSSATTVSSTSQHSQSHRKPPLSSRKLAPRPSQQSRSSHHPGSLSNMLKEDEQAMRPANQRGGRHIRTVVTFDFSSSTEGAGVAAAAQPLCINLSEESLWVLRSMVYRSGLIYRSAADVCKTIMRLSHKRVWDGRPLVTLRRDDFRHLIRTLLSPPPPSSATKTPQNRLTSTDIENFGMILEDFFACFEGNFHQSTTTYHPLSHDEVNAKELAVGFCFLCAGNKSTKLATGFELLDDDRAGYLTQQQLMRFLRSYLTMMVGTSFLKDNHSRKRQPLSHERKEEMRAAVENGANWTLRHFLKNAREKHPESHAKDAYTFEVFADWYSKGGFSVAPWLELLDLNKLVSLLGESESFAAMPQGKNQRSYANSQPSIRECRSSHRRNHHNRSSAPPAQVLFTFPLANQRSLIVLREDAIYVRGVVEQLGALSLSAQDIWSTLLDEVKKRPGLRGPNGAKARKKNAEPDKNTMLDQNSFVQMMEIVLQSAAGSGRKRAATGSSKLSSSVQELLSNFFHSYDLKQTKMVALNELMGGLSLLCGGKKSTKLAFAFGAFDGRPQPKTKGKKKQKLLKTQSLDGKDLYLFLRSFMIVLFSCCCQTLDMSDKSVDRYIADTATMVADDVMRYQWHTRKVDRIDFDEFGEWYNEGGFEIAPWLELLDLKKWVLVDNFDALDNQAPPTPSQAGSMPLPAAAATTSPKQQSPTCPPPPPEDVLDPSFFEGDHDDIMHMDSIDEMDIMLMPSHDKDGDLLPVSKFTYSPSQDLALTQDQPAGDDGQNQPLKFHLLSEDEQGGFMLSISQKRIGHLRRIMVDSGLHEIATETACTAILNRASGSAKSKTQRTITKSNFEAAVEDILGIKDQGAGDENNTCLSDVLSFIFSAFDVNNNGKPNALEVACGFTVLCRGKKSDKLEYAFEVLDKDKKGVLSKDDMFNYMRSFLTVLLGIACTPSLETDELEDTLTTMNSSEECDRSTESLMRAVDAGSKWAVAQAFKRRDGLGDSITFDDFAAWYTEEGHISIPWIELLALRKWLI